MRQVKLEIISNRTLAPDIHELTLEGDVSAITAPGQFVNLKLDGFYLRRPISVADWGNGLLVLIVKVLGRGTAALCRYPVGTVLDVLTGLGNGYDLSKSGKAPLLIGGGVGIPPLYGLARRLVQARNVKPAAVLGFNRAEDVFLVESFEALGIPVTVCTADGSRGVEGLVTDGMAEAAPCTYFYACGPEPMLKAVYEMAGEVPGQFSFEERMGCGFGACMGCTCVTKYGTKRICRDGPVLEKEEIRW